MWRAVAAASLSCAAYDCDAVDQVMLEIGQASLTGVQVSGATLTLDVSATPTVRAQIARLQLAAAGATFTDVDVTCAGLVAKQPQFACGEGSVAARGGPTGLISMQASGAYDSSSTTLSVSGSGLTVAGGDAGFNGTLLPDGWSLTVDANGLDLISTRKLAAHWLQPGSNSIDGRMSLKLEATGRFATPGRAGRLQAHWTARTADLNFANQAGTTVGQKLAASLNGTVLRAGGKVTADVQIQGTAGQALAGPVLLDFAVNPLDLRAHLELAGVTLAISQVRIAQRDLIDAVGQAQVCFGDRITLAGHFDVQRLEFAAAYRSFLQLTLATTDFGALNAGGHASGALDIANNSVDRLSARLENVSLADPKIRLSLANANGEMYWDADPRAARPSKLSWSSSSAYGLLGGAVQMSFLTGGTSFALSGDTRFPLFDGALIVHQFAVRGLGAQAELDFDAQLEPISMPLVSRAFGWPTLSGQLAGRIPGVTYRDHVLAVEGDLSATVFDGTIVGSHFKVRDPLGPWPRLDADVHARRLDLDLLTHTFSIGSITGRLDADVTGLELFNWSPIAFDASLHSTPGDRSKHLISQKAVTSISSVGGGGGGVSAALQSGVLKFFDKFHYDRIGISCQLRDEVCLMKGIEPARTGYYMVKGLGIPRIDIIGNAGRVDWPQLVGQIAAGMNSQNIIVR